MESQAKEVAAAIYALGTVSLKNVRSTLAPLQARVKEANKTAFQAKLAKELWQAKGASPGPPASMFLQEPFSEQIAATVLAVPPVNEQAIVSGGERLGPFSAVKDNFTDPLANYKSFNLKEASYLRATSMNMLHQAVPLQKQQKQLKAGRAFNYPFTVFEGKEFSTVSPAQKIRPPDVFSTLKFNPFTKEPLN